MDCSPYKIYHVHGCDSRQLLEDYFSDKSENPFVEDAIIFPMEQLTKTFADGHIKGDVLIDLSIGPMVHHLYAASECFKHIIVMKAKDRCIMELKKWLNTHTGAFDWGHATKIHVDIGGKSDQLEDKEGKVRCAIQHVLKCNLEKENMTAPIVLPPADCIISVWLLDNVCKDQHDYIRYLRKFSMLLKPGGHLLLIGAIERTYWFVGKDKLHGFGSNQDFVRKALVGEGFIIDCCKVKKRTAVSDITNYTAVLFIEAHKGKYCRS